MANAPRQLETVDVGHIVVGDDEADVGVLLQRLNSGHAVFRRTDPEIVAFEPACQQRARRGAIVHDQHVMALIGQEAAYRFSQHIDGKDAVLDDVIDHFLGQQPFANAVLESRRENDRRHAEVNEVVQRLAVFGTGKVDVGNGECDGFRIEFIRLLEIFERPADLDINAEKFFQLLPDHGREDIGVFADNDSVFFQRLAGVLHARNAQKIHDPPTNTTEFTQVLRRRC